jgi:hypothetical protein
MLEVVKTRKEIQFKYGVTTEARHKNGKLCMLTRLKKKLLRVEMRSMDSTSTDHSTLDQDCHSRESLSVTVPTMFG